MLSILILAASFLVSPGLFILDELIYYAGSDAMLSHGSFAVRNGLVDFTSADTRLLLLVLGPDGLAPQYPAGHAIAGAAFMALYGDRGLILLNVVAAVGQLFATRALAIRLFGDERAALISVLLLFGATFWLEYVYAVWPHSVAMLCVTMALVFMIDCLGAKTAQPWKAVAAGVAVGFGMVFRTDTILALPVIGLVVMLFGVRPFRTLWFVGLGLVPFVAFACFANYAKFGTFNPLSYGQPANGGTSLSAHLAPIIGLVVVSLLIVALRFVSWRPRRRDFVIGGGCLVLLLLFSPAVSELAHRYAFGAWALLVDATIIADPRPGVVAEPGGLLSFWGLWKKALGQSMPWLGLLFLLIHARTDDTQRRSLWIVLVLAAVWSLPFFAKAWHGGMGSNMRYFLPVLPALCAVVAWLLIEMVRSVAKARYVLMLGALVGIFATTAWTTYTPTQFPGAQQILSTWLLAVIAGLSVLSGLRWSGQKIVRAVCLGATGAGMAVSTLFLIADFTSAQVVRRVSEAGSVALMGLPEPALVYAPSRSFWRWAFQPGHVAALPRESDGAFDFALIDRALANGQKVFVWRGYVNDGLRARYGVRLVSTDVVAPGGEFLEITRLENDARK